MAQTVQVELLVDHFGDPLRRLHNGYYSIVNEQGVQVPFRANWAQSRFLEEIHTLNVILKARQLGFSTVIDMLGLDAAIFEPNTRVGIIAQTLPDVKEIFRTKVKEPWEALEVDIQNKIGARQDASTEMVFGNGSSLRVGTSLRSSTTQFLHISEYGKICAKYPEKAREIRSGALNTIHAGNLVFIESTAEGREGDFYEKCETARHQQEEGRTLSVMDYRFHFYAWWQHSGYTLSRSVAMATPIPDEFKRYFRKLHDEHDIELSLGQQAWYVKKAEEQRGDMTREFPSTPQEAFEQAIEGAYYATQMARVRKDGRIGIVPHDPRYPVHTAWDIGRNDSNAIWLFQDGPLASYRFIGYLEDSGEPMQHYGRKLQERQEEGEGFYFGTCYLPHDGGVTDYTREDGKTRAQVLESMGFRVEVIPAVASNAGNGEGHQACRDALALSSFDQEACSGGIKCLDHYQKEWSDRIGAFRDQPLHNWASHGAKAYETFARGHMGRVHVSDGTSSRQKRRRNWRTA